MTMYRKRILALLFLLTGVVTAHSQDMSEDETIVSKKGYSRFLGVGAGVTYRTFLDEAISSLRYSKIGAAGTITNIKINETKYTELYFQGSYLQMNRKSDPLVKANATSLNVLMDYRHLYKIGVPFLNDGIYDVRVGGIFTTQYCNRNAPHLNYSSNVNEYAISLGLSSKIARQHFIAERKSYIIWELSMPFISCISRPDYLNHPTILSNEDKGIGNVFANNKFTSFGRFFRLNSRVSILYPIKNGNKLRFTYQWDYYKMKGPGGKVYSAEHSLIMTFLFNY